MKYKFTHLIKPTVVRTTVTIDSDESDESQTLEKKSVDFEESEINVSFQIK